MNRLMGFGMAAAVFSSMAALKGIAGLGASRDATGLANGEYRALAPIESGDLLLFPVARAGGRSPGAMPFITLDEGLKNGQVEVTEAGRVQGLIRPRGDAAPRPLRGDQVNTLVLVNNSEKPLLLLAGEIVTGGKQDRVIAKDRIVPAGGDPIDLGVFCIEPGRWVASSDKFGAAANGAAASFMVQPAVRQQAMVAKNQQEVWNSVAGTISNMAVAAARAPDGSGSGERDVQRTMSTSYAKAMQDPDVTKKVDEAAAPVMKTRERVLARLKQEQAVGVVVAVRGELVWADLFADTDLLSRYWTKLVRSYAAESLGSGEDHAAPTVADAQRFLEASSDGSESSEGDVGVYRYTELNSGDRETFTLESLLPGTGYEVHISRLKVRGADRRPRPGIAR
jgi:hypothetical protein